MSVIQKLISNLAQTVVGNKSNFVGNNVNEKNKEKKMANFLIILAIFLITLALILLLSKWLWNSCVVQLVPVRKCENVWHLVGMSVLVGLLFGNQTPPQ